MKNSTCMKKFYNKLLHHVRIYWPRQLTMLRNCIILLLCFIVFLTVNISFASHPDIFQQNLVTGTVRDSVTGEPLIGVTVVVSGTTLGTITDAGGLFSIKLPQKEATLTFSYIGYVSQDIRVTQGTTISVAMALEVTEISEVVVVGYGVQKKESVVGAISQVESTTLIQSGTQNITNAISGKLSGVLTIQQSGEPGANAAEIIVRGLSSWNSSAPLVLVDGVERDFRNVDPNEINTISVLKDASATAVFGAKGANGVIIVTTKRGSLGKPKMNYSFSFGQLKASRIPDHISSYTLMSMRNVANMNDQQYDLVLEDYELNEYLNPSSPLKALQYPNVNWFKECVEPFTPVANANINISGGTEFIKYFASFGYQYEGNLFVGYKDKYMDSRFKNNRFNYRTNVDFSLTRSTLLSLNLGGDINIKNQPSAVGDVWGTIYESGPAIFPAYFPEWVLQEVPDPDYPEDTGWRRAAAYNERWGNPYSNFVDGTFRNYTGSKVFTDLIFDQKLDNILRIKGLSVKGKISLSTYNRMLTLTGDYRLPEYYLHYDRIGIEGLNPWERGGQTYEAFNLPPVNINIGKLQADYYTDLYYEMSLNYANRFGKHSVSGLALMNRQEKNLGLDFPYYNEALAGRVTYDYDRKYFLEVNLGYTGSERFAPGNRFGFFPSGALGWTVSEEPFFKVFLPVISRMKLRYSDGLVGSDYAENRWLYISEYYTTTVSSVGYIREDKGANLSAQWEEARKRDIGVELGFFKNKFTLTVDLFDEQRSKMLLTPQSVTFMVGNSFKDLNLGQLKKHGFEIEAEYNNTTVSKLNYFVRGMFGFNENRVIYKDDLPYAPDYQKAAGKPLGMAHNRLDSQAAGVLTTGTGYFTSVDDIHNNPVPISINNLNLIVLGI